MRSTTARIWMGLVLATLLVAAGVRAPARAEPADDGRTVLLYPETNFRGTPRRFRLRDGVTAETSWLLDSKRRDRSQFGSLRVGRWVGVLFQEAPWGDPHEPTLDQETGVFLEDSPDLGLWKKRALRHIVVFHAAKEGDRRRGQIVRIREYPDGAELTKYRLHHIQGGLDPRLPAAFASSDGYLGRYPPKKGIDTRWRRLDSQWQGKLPIVFLSQGGYHWLRVYGRQTVVTLKAGGGQKWSFTTKGKPSAEYDLNQFMVTRRILSFHVMPRVITIVPDDSTTGLLGAKATARDYWVYPGGHYIKTTATEWEVYARGRKVHAFQEVKRTPGFVELKSKTHPLWVRLQSDSSLVRDPGRGAPQWTKQYDGRWQERPREGVVVPGALPVAPSGPAALLRTVPRVLGMTREAGEQAIRSAGLNPVLQRLSGGPGGGTRIVAQRPQAGATLAFGGRVTLQYRDEPPTVSSPPPGAPGSGPGVRTYWAHGGGSFTKTGATAWVVHATGRKTFPLEEVRRTKEYVELRSGNGEIRILLRKDSAWILAPKRGVTKWTKRYEGRWRAAPAGGG